MGAQQSFQAIIAADEDFHADAVMAELALDPGYEQYIEMLEALKQEELYSSGEW